MKILVINDQLTSIPGTSTFWSDLVKWFDAEFMGGDYSDLTKNANSVLNGYGRRKWDLIIRNGSYFGPIESTAPQISLIQDIFEDGPARKMQSEVIKSSTSVVFNSEFTKSKYIILKTFAVENPQVKVIPIPVDFDLFRPGNLMGLQQALSIPDGAVCWIGAAQEAAHIKGWDIFLSIVRQNPDIPFVGIFKDQQPEYGPTNLRMYTKVNHEELVKIIGACRVGLCTSRVESQHLAGIEMGACGLPMVAPPVGTYWKRDEIAGLLEDNPTISDYTNIIRNTRAASSNPEEIRNYWQKEFDKPVIRKQWETLVQEVENDRTTL